MLVKLALHAGVLVTGLALGGSALADAPKADKAAPSAAPKAPAKKAPAGKSDKKKASTLDLEALKKDLESGDEPRTLDALGRIGDSGEAEAAPLVEALLARGANTNVLLRAIEVARKLAQPSSAAALVPYVGHRKPEVRRAAASALALTKAPEAAVALRKALRSNDPQLRAIAARGLGKLGAKDAVEDLFAVLPKDVPEAAASIGALCVGAECERFIELMGKLPFDVMESGLEPLFLRPSADVSDDLKIKIVERLQRLTSKAATELLTRTKTILPADTSPKVKQAIEAALRGKVIAEGRGK